MNEVTHIKEGDLIRYLDNEMVGGERQQVATHLIACRECSQVLDGIRAERRHFAQLLAEVSVPLVSEARRAESLAAIRRAAKRQARPDRFAFARPGLRAAAVAGVLVASAAFASSPVRAWIGDLLNGSEERAERLAPRTAAPRPGTLPLENSAIGFVPSSDVFVLEIAQPQQIGKLILGVSDGSSVTARAIGDAKDVDVLVKPTLPGMLIENRADATADYAINLPTSIREVRVRVGSAPELVYRAEVLSATWISVVELNGQKVSPDRIER